MSGDLRRSVLERDGHLCLHCGTDKWLTIDHVLPRFQGGSEDIENLQTLCRACHDKKDAMTANAAEERWSNERKRRAQVIADKPTILPSDWPRYKEPDHD